MAGIIDNWKEKLETTEKLYDFLVVIKSTAKDSKDVSASRHLIRQECSDKKIFRLLDKRLFDTNRDLEELIEEVKRELDELKV